MLEFPGIVVLPGVVEVPPEGAEIPGVTWAKRRGAELLITGEIELT